MTPVQRSSTFRMRWMSQGFRHPWAILLAIGCLARMLIHRKASFWLASWMLFNSRHRTFNKKLRFKRTNSLADWTSWRKSSIYSMAKMAKISRISKSWKIIGTLAFHTSATMSPSSSSSTTLRSLKQSSSISKNTMSCFANRITSDYLNRNEFFLVGYPTNWISK